MSNFLDRVVSRAIAPAGPAPRFASVEGAGETYGNPIDVELNTAPVGDPESDRTAMAIDTRQPFTPPPLATARQRDEIVPVPPPVFEKDAPPETSNAARCSAQRSDGEIQSHPAPIGTMTRDRNTPLAPWKDPPVTQTIHEPAIRTVRHEVRADPAIVVRAAPPLALVATRPDAAYPIPGRFAAPAGDSAQPSARHPAFPLQREHPAHVAPRAAVDGAAFRDSRVPMSPTSRGHATTPSPDVSREPPTVHVTIGRLEIRAPQPAPVTVPRQAAAPGGSRLEAYLEKRASKDRR